MSADGDGRDRCGPARSEIRSAFALAGSQRRTLCCIAAMFSPTPVHRSGGARGAVLIRATQPPGCLCAPSAVTARLGSAPQLLLLRRRRPSPSPVFISPSSSCAAVVPLRWLSAVPTSQTRKKAGTSRQCNPLRRGRRGGWKRNSSLARAQLALSVCSLCCHPCCFALRSIADV